MRAKYKYTGTGTGIPQYFSGRTEGCTQSTRSTPNMPSFAQPARSLLGSRVLMAKHPCELLPLFSSLGGCCMNRLRIYLRRAELSVSNDILHPVGGMQFTGDSGVSLSPPEYQANSATSWIKSVRTIQRPLDVMARCTSFEICLKTSNNGICVSRESMAFLMLVMTSSADSGSGFPAASCPSSFRPLSRSPEFLIPSVVGVGDSTIPT